MLQAIRKCLQLFSKHAVTGTAPARTNASGFTSHKSMADSASESDTQATQISSPASQSPTSEDGHSIENAELRLERLCHWCITGRAAEAELEIYAWQRHSNCPGDAVVLLASRLAQRKQYAQALQLLHNLLEHTAPKVTNDSQDDSSNSSTTQTQNINQLIATVKWLEEESQQAASSTSDSQLAQTICETEFHVFENTSDLSTSHSQHSRAEVELLASELLDRPELITSLVAAQKIERDHKTIALLRAAAARVVHDIERTSNFVAVCTAAANLAVYASDVDDARRWAHRGLRKSPFNASLAMILSSIEDDETIGPPASTVLLGAVNRFPRYPDLRAALIRREFAEGRTDIAKRRLAQWLTREPNQALATELEQELAA